MQLAVEFALAGAQFMVMLFFFEGKYVIVI